MTAFTINDNASLEVNSSMVAVRVNGLFAGEAIDAFAPCYIDSDGTVKMAVSTQLIVVSGDKTDFIGFAPREYANGEAITLFGKGARFCYSTSMTPGSYLYIGSEAGTLVDAAVVEGDDPVAVALTSTDVLVTR